MLQVTSSQMVSLERDANGKRLPAGGKCGYSRLICCRQVVKTLSWTIRRAKKKKSIVVPALLAGLCFISAYLYL